MFSFTSFFTFFVFDVVYFNEHFLGMEAQRKEQSMSNPGEDLNESRTVFIEDELLGSKVSDPGELEEVLETAVELIDSPGFHEAIEMHDEVVLICAYAELADKLARYGVDEEKRIAIARLGRDRKYERCEELFNILANPEQIAKLKVRTQKIREQYIAREKARAG